MVRSATTQAPSSISPSPYLFTARPGRKRHPQCPARAAPLPPPPPRSLHADDAQRGAHRGTCTHARTRAHHTHSHTQITQRVRESGLSTLSPQVTSLSASHPYAHHVPVRITSASRHTASLSCPVPSAPMHLFAPLIRVTDPSHLSESSIRVFDPDHAVGRPAHQAAGCRLRLSPPRRPAAGPPAAPPLISYSPLCRARANSARTAVQYTQPLLSNFCC